MEGFTILAYEFACTALPAFAVFVMADLLRRSDESRVKSPSIMLGAAFSTYIFALFYFTGAGTLYDAMRFGLDLNPAQINATPFAGFASDVEGHVLNIALFVPLGAFAFAFSGGRPTLLPAALTAVVATAAIEVSQLLNSRVTDVDDLVMNVAGALIGYALCRVLWRGKRSEGRSSICPMALMLAVAFVFRFLLYNEMGLAKILLGV